MDSSCRRKTPKGDSHKSDGKQQLGSMDIRNPRSAKTYSAENMLSSNLDGMPRAKLIGAGCEVAVKLLGSAWETLIFRWVAFDECSGSRL